MENLKVVLSESFDKQMSETFNSLLKDFFLQLYVEYDLVLIKGELVFELESVVNQNEKN